MKKLISIIFLVSLIISCFVINSEATEQPGGLKQSDSILESFMIYNASLPFEIARLPDYQGNIEGNHLVALNRLYLIIEKAPPDQVKNLEVYLGIGIPEKDPTALLCRLYFGCLKKKMTLMSSITLLLNSSIKLGISQIARGGETMKPSLTD